MKKFLTIIGALTILFIVFIIGIALYTNFYPNATEWRSVYGNSMSQYGLSNGASYQVYRNHTCKVGDICSFTCLSDKCTTPSGERYGIKKLISIENDCYNFQGNDESWTENGIKVASFDSRVFGCLMPSEFKIDGVVK